MLNELATSYTWDWSWAGFCRPGNIDGFDMMWDRKDVAIFALLLCVVFMLGTFEPKRNLSMEKIVSMSQVEHTAGHVAEAHNYSHDGYNCAHFSRDLAKKYEAMGWEAQVCIGNYTYDNETEGEHTWVKVYVPVVVEATSGEIIPKYDFEKHYRENKCKPWNGWRYPEYE